MKVLGESKDMDLRHKESGQVIKLTGRGFLLAGKHGVTLETEGDFEGLDDTYVTEDSVLFKNSLTLSIAAIYSNHSTFEFIEKERCVDFISERRDDLVEEVEDIIQEFLDNNKDELSRDFKRLSLEGGITLPDDELLHGLFDLTEATILKERDKSVTKRIRIPCRMLIKLNRDKKLLQEFFDSIREEFNSLGCYSYTYIRPDGSSILYRDNEYLDYVELRVFGYIK